MDQHFLKKPTFDSNSPPKDFMKRTLALLMKKCQFPLLGNELMIYILNDAMNMILRARASLSFFECFQLSSNAAQFAEIGIKIKDFYNERNSDVKRRFIVLCTKTGPLNRISYHLTRRSK